MKGKVTVIAFHRAKPGKEQALREALLVVRASTLKEKGCINYRFRVPGALEVEGRSRRPPRVRAYRRRLAEPPDITLWREIECD
jgi:Antibiotic biosynthesis monooxygenase